MIDLAQELADIRGEAAVLRRAGQGAQASYIEGVCDRVSAAAEEFLTWLSERDAAIRCGYSETWLRARFEGWRREGHARLAGRARQYRALIVPRRANTVTAAARGRQAARDTARDTRSDTRRAS